MDAYLAGHDHDLEALKPDGGVRFFISGGGGAELRPFLTDHCRVWAESTHGFTVLQATSKELSVQFFGSGGRILYQTSWRKGESEPDCPRL